MVIISQQTKQLAIVSDGASNFTQNQQLLSTIFKNSIVHLLGFAIPPSYILLVTVAHNPLR